MWAIRLFSSGQTKTLLAGLQREISEILFTHKKTNGLDVLCDVALQSGDEQSISVDIKGKKRLCESPLHRFWPPEWNTCLNATFKLGVFGDYRDALPAYFFIPLYRRKSGSILIS